MARTRPTPIRGITRLQKLLFLVFEELKKISPNRELTLDFAFQPQRYGPADLELYADLEFLIAVGHIERTSSDEGINAAAPSDEATVAEATEHELSFDYLMANEDTAATLAAADRQPDEVFAITITGMALLERIRDQADARSRAALDEIDRVAAGVKARFADWPLPKLLRYVYGTYPEMTTASEIRERVLGHH
jgi:hypothetical protein